MVYQKKSQLWIKAVIRNEPVSSASILTYWRVDFLVAENLNGNTFQDPKMEVPFPIDVWPIFQGYGFSGTDIPQKIGLKYMVRT